MLLPIGWLIVFAVIGAMVIPLVRFLGPVGIRNYVLEELYDSDTGYYNVAYRIISPALCCAMLVSLAGVIALATGGSAPTACYLPLVFYWLFLGTIKVARKSILSPIAFILEALASIGIAVLFYIFVIRRFLNFDFAFIDDSSIAFQAEMAVFAFLVQAITSLFMRRQYRVNYGQTHTYSLGNRQGHRTTFGNSNYGYSPIDVSEKKLFEYERQFGSMLPKRFSSDPLLRCVFFSIMAIEDSNRPKGFRFFERVACAAGLAHSTGIMQQKSDKPLTDRDSVELATAYIERMWDSFLVTFAKSAQGGYSPNTLTFTSSWYRYDYNYLADLVENAFGFFYGDYCGTRLLDAGFIFSQVKGFWERNRYGFLPQTVISSWSVSPIEAAWFDGEEIYWEDDYTVSRTTRPKNLAGYEFIVIDGNGSLASCEKINELHRHIESHAGIVTKITLVESVHVIVCAYCAVEQIDGSFNDEWRISRADLE